MIVLDVAAILGVLCLVLGGVALVSGMRLVIFSTGSMAPAIPAGSLALTVPVAAEDIGVGDVITAERAGDRRLVTHRVVSVREGPGLWLVTMRGDANNADDGTPYDVTEGAQRLVAAMPGVGDVVASVRMPWVLVAVLALLLVLAIPTRQAKHRLASREAQEEEAPGPGLGGR